MLLWAWGHFFFFFYDAKKEDSSRRMHMCFKELMSGSKNDTAVRIHVWLEAFPCYALMELILQLTASFGFYNSNYETPLQK